MGTASGDHGGLTGVFRSLLIGSAISNLGDGIRLAALPLLAASLTDSALLVAGVTAAQFLPWLVVGPIGGVIVDRADRRRLIVSTQIVRAVVMLGLAVAVLGDLASIWMVCVVAFVITAGEILVDPATVATVPTIVEQDDLDRANGQISSSEIVTNNLIGSPLGAALFSVVSWVPFAVDAVSYAGSTVLLRALPSAPRREAPRGFGSVVDEMPEGFRFLARHPMLRPWTAAVAIFNVGASAAFSLLVLLIIDEHDSSELGFGVALTAAAVGGVVGSSIAPRLAERRGRPSVMLASGVVNASSLIGLWLAPSLIVVIALWAIGGLVGGIMLALGRGYIQRFAPNEVLGRTAIASRTITRTAFVIGALLGGFVAESDIRLAFLVAGAMQFVALIPMAISLRHDDATPAQR